MIMIDICGTVHCLYNVQLSDDVQSKPEFCMKYTSLGTIKASQVVVVLLSEDHFNVHVSQRSQIQFEDEDHAVT